MIFDTFPDNPELYSQDIRPIVTETISRYGREEWIAGVRTTEMHGHLGIYAIIGVKMGIRALEYLEVDAGDVSIISSAGTKPPVSCMNDGLQVSTGATLGHGLITFEQNETPSTDVIFSTEKKSVQLKLKESTCAMIEAEISGAVYKYGHSDEYWEYVRKLAVRYWYELDRKEIFEIVDR